MSTTPEQVDPRPYLTRLGIPYLQLIAPDAGYGVCHNEVVYGHWTAGNGAQANSERAVRDLHYSSCVARNGIVILGAWDSRVGHGGWGRTTPILAARQGRMDLDQLDRWAASDDGDDTNTWPNRYARAASIDYHPHQAAPIPKVQWDGFCGTTAALLVSQGGGIGNLMDHSASTARKWDLDPIRAAWWNETNELVAALGGQAMDVTAVGTIPNPAGAGFWCLLSNGRVVALGGAPHHGDRKGKGEGPFVHIWPGANGRGYVLGAASGAHYALGRATYPGDAQGAVTEENAA